MHGATIKINHDNFAIYNVPVPKLTNVALELRYAKQLENSMQYF
jgi:hypothetical protein